MKKLFTFILLLSALSVGCLFPTLGTFAMSSMDSSGMHQSMDHDMSGDMAMPCQSKDDSASMHECCESPFLDSIAYNGNLNSILHLDMQSCFMMPRIIPIFA